MSCLYLISHHRFNATVSLNVGITIAISSAFFGIGYDSTQICNMELFASIDITDFSAEIWSGHRREAQPKRVQQVKHWVLGPEADLESNRLTREG